MLKLRVPKVQVSALGDVKGLFSQSHRVSSNYSEDCAALGWFQSSKMQGGFYLGTSGMFFWLWRIHYKGEAPVIPQIVITSLKQSRSHKWLRITLGVQHQQQQTQSCRIQRGGISKLGYTLSFFRAYKGDARACVLDPTSCVRVLEGPPYVWFSGMYKDCCWWLAWGDLLYLAQSKQRSRFKPRTPEAAGGGGGSVVKELHDSS